MDLAGRQSALTSDRTEFLGRNGTLDRPAALDREHRLSGNGAGMDPCAAMQTTVRLPTGERTEFRILLGEAPTRADAADAVRRARAIDPGEALGDVERYWDQALGTIKIRTPGPIDEHPPRRLASVPDARLPGLGANGILSGERRVRLSRSVAGRHGAGRFATRRDA